MTREQVTQNYITHAMEFISEAKEFAHDNKRMWINRNGIAKIQLDAKKNLWVSIEIWTEIENVLDLPYDKVRDGLKIWFLKHYNLEGTNPICDRVL